MDENVWPSGFADIGDQTFAWVAENRPEWVDFTLHEMDEPSGLFLLWKTYLLKRKDAQTQYEQTRD